jgi:hypothetical protein
MIAINGKQGRNLSAACILPVKYRGKAQDLLIGQEQNPEVV